MHDERNVIGINANFFLDLGVEITGKSESCSEVYTSKLCSVSPDPWRQKSWSLQRKPCIIIIPGICVNSHVKSHRWTRSCCRSVMCQHLSVKLQQLLADDSRNYTKCDEQDTPTLLYYTHSTQYSQNWKVMCFTSYASIQRFKLNLRAKLEYRIKHHFHPTSQREQNLHFLVNCGSKYH